MFQLLLLFTTLPYLAYGIRTRLHMRLQVEPDQACEQWLATDAGKEYVACDTDNPGLPKPYNTSNDCMLTTDDFNLYCNNSCYDVVLKAWEFFLNTSTCLNVVQAKYGPCQNNSDCPMLPGSVSRICYEGFCYNGCNATSECNTCMGETCEDMGNNLKGCRSSEMSFMNNTNRTMETGFKGMIYSLKAGCSKNNSTGNYCGLMTLENHTCESLQEEYGCCAATILPSAKYCEWTNYTNANISNLFNCSWSVTPCNGLEWAWQACGIQNTTGGNNGTNNSSSSSGMSSGIIGSGSSSGISNSSSISGSGSGSGSGSSSIIITNSSQSSGMSSSLTGSHSNISSPTGPHLNGTDGNGASPNKAISSWTITIALVFVAANFMSS